MAGLAERLRDFLGIIPPEERKKMSVAPVALTVEPPKTTAEHPLDIYRRRATKQLEQAISASLATGHTSPEITKRLSSLGVFAGLDEPSIMELIDRAGGVSVETAQTVAQALADHIEAVPLRDARRMLQKWAEHSSSKGEKSPGKTPSGQQMRPVSVQRPPQSDKESKLQPKEIKRRKIILVQPTSRTEIPVEDESKLRELIDKSGSEVGTEAILALIEQWATHDALELQLHAKARVQWGPLSDYYAVKRGKLGTTLFRIEGDTLWVVAGPHATVYGVPRKHMKKDKR